ncbi:DER1.1, partial [Symbiodinium sp. KB8]
MSSPQEWYNSLPPVTRIYMTAAVATTSLVSFGMLSPFTLHLDTSLLFSKFQ